ncbi:MAG: sigma 54-interacting transcriptional regulator [Deltaproteobacteria bacterium]
MNGTILLVEDEKILRVTLEDALRGAGYEVLSCGTGAEGHAALRENPCDVVVTDVRLPDGSGFDLVREIAKAGTAKVIVMTAYGTIRDAVEAMKLGAFDYLTKPFDLDEFLLLVERAMEMKRLEEENIRLRKDLSACRREPGLIGESGAMKRVLSLVAKVSASPATVLILGESGTGKELIATAIHHQSDRAGMPLIKMNCSTLPEGLIESELFGHERGAFTGAVRRKPGRFELADGGTLFLDEIGDLPPATQSKILRVLQERQFERVGGTRTLSVNVRLLAATNRNLEEEVAAGRFREDLYYRLNVIPIHIPPLRERKEDIPALVEFFLQRYGKPLSRTLRMSPEAMEALLRYDYPGNVRELENLIERCVTLAAGETIGPEDLPPRVTGTPKTENSLLLSRVAADAEKNHILSVLKSAGGVKSRAAELLGISRKTLWEKMNLYGIR